jgi:hypothetical protein
LPEDLLAAKAVLCFLFDRFFVVTHKTVPKTYSGTERRHVFCLLYRVWCNDNIFFYLDEFLQKPTIGLLSSIESCGLLHRLTIILETFGIPPSTV